MGLNIQLKPKIVSFKESLVHLKQIIQDAELMSPHDDGINGNPVGDLQEMCMNRRLPPPVYEVGLEKGRD